MNNVDQTVDDVLCMDEYPKDTFDWDSRVAANFLIDVFSLHKDLGTAMGLSEVLSDFMMKHGGYIMQSSGFGSCGREEK